MADGIEAVRQKVREQIKYGADLIKFMASGGVLSKGDDPQASQYSREEMQMIVSEAHRLRRKVAVHAHGSQAILWATEAGADSIEHGSFITDQDISAMKEHSTYLVPTLYTGEFLLEDMQAASSAAISRCERARSPARRQEERVSCFRAWGKGGLWHRCGCLSSWFERSRV